MALTQFKPDPDLFDPEDDEAWYGTWKHDDGTELYGQGDPEIGRELLAANDAPPASPYGQQNMTPAQPSESREVLDAGAPMPPRGLDPALEAQSLGQPPPSIARPPEAPGASPDWADDVPPSVASALEQHATEAGLDPGALAATIKHESGWDPSKGSGGDAGRDVHAGLIQFSKKLWPGVAAAAGQPDVTFEEMRAMSAEEQVPFVIAYYKGKGLTPQSSPGDYRLATYKPAHLDKGDDFELDNAADTKGIPVDAKNARLDRNGDGVINSYEQNAGLDTNRDGLITTGEVRGGAGGTGGAMAPGAQGVAPRGTMPGSIGGIPLAEVQQQGIPLTPEQVAQRQGDVAQRYAAVSGMQQLAQQERIRGREEVQAEWTQAYQQQGKDAAAEEAKQVAIAQEAQQKIDQEVNQPIQKVDPRRYITEMSTGAAVLGALGVILAGLGQAKAMSMGMNPGSNSGLDALNKAIDQDVQLQKEDIQQGRERSANRIAHWSRILGNAEQGERAARAEAKQAAAGMLQAKAMKSDIAEIRAGGMQQAAALFAQGQQEIQAITDAERKNLTARYAIPKPGAGPGALQGVPKLAPVGTEDKDPRTRAALANAYDPTDTADRGQMNALTKEMSDIEQLKKTLDGLKQWYGVSGVTDGNFPEDKDEEGGPDYDSSATGPAWNPGNWADNDQRDRELRDLWATVETNTRTSWKAEPNGEVTQQRLSGVAQPKRDAETGQKLRELQEEIRRREHAIMSGTHAPVRAAWKYQNGYPIEGASGGGRPVTGKIGGR